MFSIEERKAQIERVYAAEPRVTVCSYEGLTTDFAAEVGATALLRSIRTVKDMEYERDLADVNRRISVGPRYPQGIDTVLLFALPEHAAVSSSIVRELLRYGHDASAFLPA
jgi:pantetheine-phosphate adenylyltransferase